ncbi:unnamed protein product [Microthlaspi erraticum]|uniref:Arabidopsis retrotransposon Orf1 C-terminal domain-containing protein n=1 Tax=Microthlaspi erraticum TaxID=1685480 RepID=A0A6D2I0V0_9BRAS|nr:unnamed protein product [Microthlaspi erraticum]
MRESSHRPLIFGTPFLSTVGAIFDFPNQRISFNKVNKGMFFPMCSTKNSFVDMVQEEKATLKPPQEGETEETIKEDPIPKPKQLAKQARSKTKAPTPKPPKGSTKIEDEAKPRRKVRKPRSGRNMKLLFPKELIDENLEGFKEKILIARRKDLEDQDASCLHLLLSAKPYSQAKDLKQALHGRQPMRIEGEKGVKTQSAKTLAADAQKVLAEQFQPGRPYRSSREGTACSAGYYARQNRPSARTTGRKRPRSAESIGTDRPCRSIRETNDRPRPILRRNLADQIARPRQNHRPKLFSAKLGSSSSNARAAIPTSPHSIDANQEHVESPRGEDDWALVSFVGEQIQDPRKCKKAMEKVNIEPCVKMDTQTLDLLKIRDDVTWYIRKLGLSKLFKLECSDANGRISISALCQLFGLPNETAHDFKENSKRKQAAFADWTHFANEPFLPSRSKVSRITHPAIRYVHRLISTTFQCKQEANKVTTDEFYILTTPFIKHEYKANLGLLLAKTFINVRKLAQDLEGNKKLCVRFGRLITAIVQHVGIDIPNYEPLPKPTPLDLHAFSNPLPKPLD